MDLELVLYLRMDPREFVKEVLLTFHRLGSAHWLRPSNSASGLITHEDSSYKNQV